MKLLNCSPHLVRVVLGSMMTHDVCVGVVSKGPIHNLVLVTSASPDGELGSLTSQESGLPQSPLGAPSWSGRLDDPSSLPAEPAMTQSTAGIDGECFLASMELALESGRHPVDRCSGVNKDPADLVIQGWSSVLGPAQNDRRV